MKIAVISPSPVPFTLGGAETLTWGLADAINQQTGHQAELIKLPSPEGGFREILESYEMFSRLDLSHFDQIISNKYPAWMVHHPRHVVYLLHTLRGLYDTYPRHLSRHVSLDSPPAVRWALEFMTAQAGSRESLPEFFGKMKEYQENGSLPEELLTLPGPFLRQIVHFLDRIGLASEAIKVFFAIAHNVVRRKDYFPFGANVKVIHPPSNLQPAPAGRFDYLLTVSRLDGAKRIDLLIQAMHHVKHDIPLKIAGTGPHREALERLAAGDPRIEFLGFVDNASLPALYANALAVPFIPYDEDYGLVTIEAMSSGKPVLTTTDAGEATEFVKDGQTGFSVAPDPKAIAKKITYFCEHPDEARRMGQQARQRVRHITWEAVVRDLLYVEEPCRRAPALLRRRKPRMTVTTTFPIYPPRGGGQSRIYHLYRELAASYEIELVTFTGAGEHPFDGEIAPGVREIRVPHSLRHQLSVYMSAKRLGVPVTDVVMPRLYNRTPDYVTALRDSTGKADVVVASHPYLYPALAELAPSKPLWYEAHNIEIDLKRTILPASALSERYLALVERVERECCQAAEVVFACADTDIAVLTGRFGMDPDRLYLVPNGFDPSTVHYTDGTQRTNNKARLGLADTFVVVFMGSWHGPNLEAVEEVHRLAEEQPQLRFLVMGSAGLAFEQKPCPANVGYLGVVDDETKGTVLSVADVALNPMRSGSGSNLKMLDYIGAGIPVLTTPHGLRGLILAPNEDVLVRELDGFGEELERLCRIPAVDLAAMAESARKVAEDTYAWPVIGQRFLTELRSRHPSLADLESDSMRSHPR